MTRLDLQLVRPNVLRVGEEGRILGLGRSDSVLDRTPLDIGAHDIRDLLSVLHLETFGRIAHDFVIPVDAVQQRLARHRAVLAAHGVTDLRKLGVMDLDASITPQQGVTVPTPQLYLHQVPFFHAMQPSAGDPATLTAISGNATLLATLPPPVDLSGRVDLDTAYWAAREIHTAPGTVIVLRRPQRYLTILCETLELGQGTIFTWEEPRIAAALYTGSPNKKRGKPPKPAAESLDGTPGAAGVPGDNGKDQVPSESAPEIEIWALNIHGSPIVCLRGQDGQPGGDGQDGGDGGDGADGLPEIPVYVLGVLVDCRRGAGAGGDGGPPGKAGNGGRGGDGGHGGRITLYAPQDQLTELGRRGFLLNCAGGGPGPGGRAGLQGVGGNGGERGAGSQCRTSVPRGRGKNWTQPNGDPRGEPGTDGPSGNAGGDHGADAQHLIPITTEQFLAELVKPVLAQVAPVRARPGDTVAVTGVRFNQGDRVHVGGDRPDQAEQPAETTVVSDTQLSFRVPDVLGGHQLLRLHRPDGTLSNRATLLVLPTIAGIEPSGRLRPGQLATVVGGGFTPDARVRLSGYDMDDVDTSEAARGRLTFRVQRPPFLAKDFANETGEPVELTVVIPAEGGTSSNAVPALIDTYRILVIGDSVLWGQGLTDAEKIHTLVEQQVLAGPVGGGRMVYTTHLAHSGAIIGVGDASSGPFGGPVEGEVPVSYPTISQQAATYAARPGIDPGGVDLVLLNGGLNDINIRTVLNPTTSFVTLAQLIDQHCYGSMRALLAQVTGDFPNARIVVTGYYPLISHHSDTNVLPPALAALGVTIGVPVPVLGELVSRSRLLYRRSRVNFAAAVAAINEDLPEPRITLADLDFGEEHSTLTADPWLFGISHGRIEGNLVVNDQRAAACQLRYPLGPDRLTCENASIGHPNPEGARRFVAAVMAALGQGATTGFDAAALPALPESFLFGVATAGQQVEGDLPNSDWEFYMNSPTIVDRVRRTLRPLNSDPVARLEPPGDGVRHHDLDVLRADLDRAAELGVNAYRMSVEWSRLQPTGDSPDQLDQAGVEYYRAVLGELLARGMRPIVTLNHLALPQWVLTPPAATGLALPDLAGVPSARETEAFKASLRGWETRATVDAFVRFVGLVWDRLGDLVQDWITVNEPVGSMVAASYLGGAWSPGFLLDGDRAKRAYLNIIRAHVLAHDTIKGRRAGDRVGFAHNMMAVRRTIFPGVLDNNAAVRQLDYFYNEHWLEATLRGRVDTAIAARDQDRVIEDPAAFFGAGFNPGLPWPRADFLGINYYRSVYGYADAVVGARANYTGGAFHNNLADKDEPHYQLNNLGWEINPRGLGETLARVAGYGLPIILTENGLPEPQDANRAAYVVAHLAEIALARADGIDVAGYLHWTLTDNWEWLDGYAPEARFGLYRVDRGPAGTDGGGPRQLTEAGVAYAMLRHFRSPAAASELFGRYDRDGVGMRAPRKSLDQWEARLGSGQRFRLLLGGDGFGLVRGLDAAGRGWRRLDEVAFDRGSSQLSFTGTVAGARRRFTGVVLGATVSGTTDDGTTWDATRDSLAGMWNSPESTVSELAVHLLGAERYVKALLAGTPPRWSPGADLTFDGVNVSWRVPLVGGVGWLFTGTVSGELMQGSLQLLGSRLPPLPWQARRRAVALTG